MMKPQKEVRISNWAAHLTTGVSVTLALLTLGIIALIWIAAANESRRVMEKIEISVIMADSVSDNRALEICEAIRQQPFTLHAVFISKEQALRNWQQATGEDLKRTFGVNPLSPEVAFTIKNEYTSSKAISKIKDAVAKVEGVAEVGTPDNEIIEAMNANIRRLTLGLTILAAVMLVISFVLINNTVRLSIYSRRFTIHTMQLVGATDGFIRRPFVMANALVGALSGLVASGIIAAFFAVAPGLGLDSLQRMVGWYSLLAMAGALVVVGSLICALAAALATTRHLGQDYEELFK
ncbi:MAG: permease-like cell division protein FtsX [Muribaculaceae bacterium]|nr:permease-like cell division protein FtsX [Muribaculaceae bacterium]